MLTTEQVKHLRELQADLRGGHFTQIKGRLKSPEGFCCLGVACERFRLNTGKGKWVDNDFNIGEHLSKLFIGSPEVRDYFGFTRSAGLRIDKFALNRHNDGFESHTPGEACEPKSFVQIAELIDKYILESTIAGTVSDL